MCSFTCPIREAKFFTRPHPRQGRIGGGLHPPRISTSSSSKLQHPSSKEAPSSKLKNRFASRSSRRLFLAWGLRFGNSLELGVWCLGFRHLAQRYLLGRFSRY